MRPQWTCAEIELDADQHTGSGQILSRWASKVNLCHLGHRRRVATWKYYCLPPQTFNFSQLSLYLDTCDYIESLVFTSVPPLDWFSLFCFICKNCLYHSGPQPFFHQVPVLHIMYLHGQRQVSLAQKTAILYNFITNYNSSQHIVAFPFNGTVPSKADGRDSDSESVFLMPHKNKTCFTKRRCWKVKQGFQCFLLLFNVSWTYF